MAEAEYIGLPHIILENQQALHVALLLYQGGKREEAEMLYRKVIAAEPANLDALNYLSLLCHRQKRREEAAALIERIIELDPTNADAHNNLGNVVETMGDDARAIALYRRAIELNPQHAPAHNNLGVVLAELGEFAEAVAVYRTAVELAPGSGEFSYNLGNAYRKNGDIDSAIDAYYAATRATPEHYNSWQGLARTLRMAGRQDEAVTVFDNLLQLKPGDPVFIYLRAACIGDEIPSRAPDAYVQTVFDDAADSFDRHLAHLEYRAPHLLVEELARLLPAPDATLDILDAGCGTGLCAPMLKPYARTLVGVDLSEGMLKKAAERGGYDDLYKCELTAFLQATPDTYDVIVSADTLCYFGELDQVMKHAASALRSGGLFAFTLEVLAGEAVPLILSSSGRYAHGRRYVEQILGKSGFRPLSFATVTLRNEGKEPVAGHLVVAGKMQV